MNNAERIVIARDDTSAFDRQIAESASSGGHKEFQRYYRLKQNRDGIARRTYDIEVYGYEDSCFLVGDQFGDWAWSIPEPDVHGLVRDILDKANYVLTYVDEEKLSDSQHKTIFREVYVDDE